MFVTQHINFHPSYFITTQLTTKMRPASDVMMTLLRWNVPCCETTRAGYVSFIEPTRRTRELSINFHQLHATQPVSSFQSEIAQVHTRLYGIVPEFSKLDFKLYKLLRFSLFFLSLEILHKETTKSYQISYFFYFFYYIF